MEALKIYKLKYPFGLNDLSKPKINGKYRKFFVEDVDITRYRAEDKTQHGNLSVKFYGRYEDEPLNLVLFGAMSWDVSAPDNRGEYTFIGDDKMFELFQCQMIYLGENAGSQATFMYVKSYRDQQNQPFHQFTLKPENIEEIGIDSTEYTTKVGKTL